METTTDRNVESRATHESGAGSNQAAAQNQADTPQSFQGTQRTGGAQGSDVAVGQSGAVQTGGRSGVGRYARSPFDMMQQLSEEMDQLFDSFFYGRPTARQGRQNALQQLWAPEVELTQQGNEVKVCVDLPGVSKDNVKIDIHEGMLSIQGERREERTEGGGEQGFRRTERRYGSFFRSIPLPEGAEAENAQASMKDGVLEIRIPLTPAKQPRRLQIEG
jgi:HSP20 family protein